jgi:hypothetical protein
MTYYLKGRLAIFTWMAYETYEDVTAEEGDWFWDAFKIAQFTAGSVFLFMPEIRFVGPKVAESLVNVAGRLAWRGATSPLGLALIGSAALWAGGAVVSNKIDPIHGVSNYVGFTTGGKYGESEIHYWSGDANDTGYFNVPENLSIIGGHYYAEAQQSADDAQKKWLARWEETKREYYSKPTWV